MEEKEAMNDESPFIVICTECKKVRGDGGTWQSSGVPYNGPAATVSHGICPFCARKLYPEYFPAESDSAA
ncbi:MAG TPA: hypothetical protein DCS63_03800 [Elusimicrobia bacterium]|nr:hypothetical protein [Elusimicrobiota bacterium]